MKINKITLLVCSILTVVSGLTMVVIESTVPDNIDASLCQSVVSGIFTGFIVSLVISVIGYFHERNIVLEKTDSNNELRNLINIRTAKLHEYVTGQTLELENIAKSFYSYKNRKCPWEMIKANLMLQVEDIVKR